MTSSIDTIVSRIAASCGEKVVRHPSTCGELTYEVGAQDLLVVCRALRDTDGLKFEQLIDVSGVDLKPFLSI